MFVCVREREKEIYSSERDETLYTGAKDQPCYNILYHYVPLELDFESISMVEIKLNGIS